MYAETLPKSPPKTCQSGCLLSAHPCQGSVRSHLILLHSSRGTLSCQRCALNKKQMVVTEQATLARKYERNFSPTHTPFASHFWFFTLLFFPAYAIQTANYFPPPFKEQAHTLPSSSFLLRPTYLMCGFCIPL